MPFSWRDRPGLGCDPTGNTSPLSDEELREAVQKQFLGEIPSQSQGGTVVSCTETSKPTMFISTTPIGYATPDYPGMIAVSNPHPGERHAISITEVMATKDGHISFSTQSAYWTTRRDEQPRMDLQTRYIEELWAGEPGYRKLVWKYKE